MCGAMICRDPEIQVLMYKKKQAEGGHMVTWAVKGPNMAMHKVKMKKPSGHSKSKLTLQGCD